MQKCAAGFLFTQKSNNGGNISLDFIVFINNLKKGYKSKKNIIKLESFKVVGNY